MSAPLESKLPNGNVPSVSAHTPDPFFHHKRTKPNGQTEEITLGAPFARVLIAVLVLIGVVFLVRAGVNMAVVTAIAGALRAAKQWL